MIRTLLVSPWLPLLYWAAAVIALICGAQHQAFERGLGRQEFEVAESASASTSTSAHGVSSVLAPRAEKELDSGDRQPGGYWDPQVFVLQRQRFSVLRHATAIVTNKTSISMEPQSPVNASTTMLSILVDSRGEANGKTLAIQCRTSVPFSNAHGRTVTIHGVVTQEVVSSSGKILIMAGSRVVGSGTLDPENGRFKSDGLWSVYFDDTELKVQAELLDRPFGLTGILGQETPNEDLALPRKAMIRDGRAIVVPRYAPFVLELHGEILLRDLKANEATN